MAAAEAVFAEQGLHGAHMNDIAERAGVAVGTLYNHFPNREALLAGLIEARRVELVARLDGNLAEGPHDVASQLRIFFDALWSHYSAHRNFLLILFQAELGQYAAALPLAARKPPETMRQLHEPTDPAVSPLRSSMRSAISMDCCCKPARASPDGRPEAQRSANHPGVVSGLVGPGSCSRLLI